jgi:hypothetical protein
MSKDEIKAVIARIRNSIVVTKVVATRSVKGRGGDSFVGFSAGWNSVQEDGGQGLVNVGGDDDAVKSVTALSLQDAVVAALIVGREADLAAHNHAFAGGNISADYHSQAVRGIKSNYSQLVLAAVTGREGTEDNGSSNPVK